MAVNECVHSCSALQSTCRLMFIRRLITACRTTGEDPVQMVQKAGKDHIPVNPSAHHSTPAASQALASLGAPARVPSPKSRPSIVSIIEDIESQESYKSQILMHRTFDPRTPRWASLDRDLPTEIDQALKEARGVTGFYTHQAQAINSFWKGRNVIVSTATASGKSIIYQVRRSN